MEIDKNLILKKLAMALCQYFFFHYHISFEVQFAFVPKGAVRQMMFAGSWANSLRLCNGLVMCSSFIPAGLRGFSFWIWHNLFYLFYFNFFNFSHRGSIVSSSGSPVEEV